MKEYIFKVGFIISIIIINIFLFILLINSVKNYVNKIENGEIVNIEENEEDESQNFSLSQIGVKVLIFILNSIIVKIILLILGIFLLICGIIIKFCIKI